MPLKERKHKMDALEESVEAYEAIRPLYEQFSTRIADLLALLLDQNGIRYQTMEHRAKTVLSFREKISRPGNEYVTPLKEIPDLAGIRVIAYYADDVARIRSLIESEFDVHSPASGDKFDEMAPQEFGYRSVHYIVMLSKSRKKLAEWRSMSDLNAEIQLRTVLQHAWAAISHALQYKHEAETPKSLRRRLFRLSGLLELADEEFATVRDEHQALALHIKHSPKKEVADFTVDRLTLKKYFEEAAVSKDIMAAAKAAGFTADDEIEDESLAVLSWTCSRAEIYSIAQLDSALVSASGKATAFLTSVLKRAGGRWGGSLAFFATMIVIGTYSERFSVDLLATNKWKRDRAGWILDSSSDI